MCSDCKNNSESGSSFIFGIFLGAIIGAVVAIYIYKNNRSEVFTDLKSKLEGYFSRFTSPKTKTKKKSSSNRPTSSKPAKIAVTIPDAVESISLTPPKTFKTRKMFKK